MIYITVPQSVMTHQMTLEEFLFSENPLPYIINDSKTNTRTYMVQNVTDTFKRRVDVGFLIQQLKQFNNSYDSLREQDRESLFYSFHIPKKSGGLRQIDAPCDELKTALTALKLLLESKFGVLYHTSAFAYVKGRSTIDAVKRHQSNESKWFAKFDISNFFGSITLEYVMSILEMIFPFSEIIQREDGKIELERALELGFYKGVLPQGTPLSPLLTNIIMIPVDFKLANALRDYNNQRFVYTRYADDFLISSKYSFKFRDIEELIVQTMSEFKTPFSLNTRKTRYGSSAGSNWNLGVLLNKDNQITVGHKRKKHFNNMLMRYATDVKNGNRWELKDVQVLDGIRSYISMVEGSVAESIVSFYSTKTGVDIAAEIKFDLKRRACNG